MTLSESMACQDLEMKRTGIKVMDVKVDDQAQRCKPRIHRADTGMKKPIDCRKWDLYLIPRVSIGAFRAALDGLVSPAVGKRANQIRAFRTRATAKITGPRMLVHREPVDASTGGGLSFFRFRPCHRRKCASHRPSRNTAWEGFCGVLYIRGFSLPPSPFRHIFDPFYI